MTDQKVRIEMTSLMHGKVFIDDVQVHRVQSVTFSAGSLQPNEVTITLFPTQVEITTPRSLVTLEELAPSAPENPET